MSFAGMAHLPEGQCLNALLMLNAENFDICLAGTRIPTVSMMAWKPILTLKHFNKSCIAMSSGMKCSKV
jgi:hypothetical protein